MNRNGQTLSIHQKTRFLINNVFQQNYNILGIRELIILVTLFKKFQKIETTIEI